MPLKWERCQKNLPGGAVRGQLLPGRLDCSPPKLPHRILCTKFPARALRSSSFVEQTKSTASTLTSGVGSETAITTNSCSQQGHLRVDISRSESGSRLIVGLSVSLLVGRGTLSHFCHTLCSLDPYSRLSTPSIAPGSIAAVSACTSMRVADDDCCSSSKPLLKSNLEG